MKYKLASYELFAIAVAGFMVDHVALYFFDDCLWARIFRMFGLVWFIAAGYNTGRKSGRWMWGGTVLMAAVAYVTGFKVLPLCALATVIVIRSLVDYVGEFAIRDRVLFWMVNLLLLVLIPLTNPLFEYGSVAVMLGLGGWLLKNRDRAKKVVDLRFYFACITTVYIVFTLVIFPFNLPQQVAVVLSTGATGALMYHFRDLLMNTLHRKNPDAVSRLCRFFGHKSLQIYVIQIVIMQLMYFI